MPGCVLHMHTLLSQSLLEEEIQSGEQRKIFFLPSKSLPCGWEALWTIRVTLGYTGQVRARMGDSEGMGPERKKRS